jgi:hypothetical protein
MTQEELDVLRILYTELLNRKNHEKIWLDNVVIRADKIYFKPRRKPWLVKDWRTRWTRHCVAKHRFLEVCRELKEHGYIDYEIFQDNIVYRFRKKYFEEFKTN